MPLRAFRNAVWTTSSASLLLSPRPTACRKKSFIWRMYSSSNASLSPFLRRSSNSWSLTLPDATDFVIGHQPSTAYHHPIRRSRKNSLGRLSLAALRALRVGFTYPDRSALASGVILRSRDLQVG